MANVVSPEMQSKIDNWRLKSDAGTITLEEMKEAVIILRQDRNSASKTTSTSKGRKKAPAKSATEMLNELGL